MQEHVERAHDEEEHRQPAERHPRLGCRRPGRGRDYLPRSVRISGTSCLMLESPTPATEPLTFFTIFIVCTSTITHVSRMPKKVSVLVPEPAGVSMSAVTGTL